MNRLKIIFYSILVLITFKTYAQNKVTTFGIQIKPIIPLNILNTGEQTIMKFQFLAWFIYVWVATYL